MALEEYRRKRDFTRTPEPSGDAGGTRTAAGALLFPGWGRLPPGRRFCVQMHHASRLHWDVRLERDGVLLSWAVPKGPTLDASQRRLAVHVEDHPVDYGDFEGIIPDGYGAGTVMLWDAGTVEWTRESEEDFVASMARGDVKFRLHGVKLNGEFAMVRLGGRGRRPAGGPDDRNWLLIKKHDEAEMPGMDAADLDISVLSGRSLAEIAAAPAATWSGPDFEGKGGGRGPTPSGEAPRGPEGTGRAAVRAAYAAPRGAATTPAAAPAPSAPAPAPVAALIDTAPRRRVPITLRPMLATPLSQPFSRPGWLYEVKYDGVRAVATVRDGAVTLRGRNGRDETRRYPELQGLAQALSVPEAVLDGEIVALDAAGCPDFELLQRRINVDDRRATERLRGEVPVVLMAFDLIGAAGHDLRDLPLTERKRALRAVLADGDAVRYADHVEEAGEAFFAAVAERGLEGMVAKRASSRYEAGRRSLAWIKVRAWKTQDAAVCGYTAGRHSRGELGALILGLLEDGRLRYTGRVGSGLDQPTMERLRLRLAGLQVEDCPFETVPPSDTAATWVKPELVCSVRYIGVTRDGTLRQPTWRGLREDLALADCVRERELSPAELDAAAPRVPDGAGSSPDMPPPSPDVAPPPPAVLSTPRPRSRQSQRKPVTPAAAPPVSGVPHPDLGRHAAELEVLAGLPNDAHWEIGGRRLRLTNLDKPLWPDGVTKRDMVAHYVRLSAALLPHLQDRPCGMQVFPDGVEGKHFWRKRIPDHAPQWIRTWTYHGDRTVTYVIVDEVATLAWMANSAAIDIHPWHSRVDAPEQPDWAVFDLDPFPPATFDDVRHIASLVRAALDHYGLRGYPKVSGQTGLQIHVPIDRGPDMSEVRHWVEEVARAIGRIAPDRVSWEWAVARRTGRIRIDYTQNVTGKTLAAPYSLRPAPGAPVSMPVRWEELDEPGMRPDRWSIHDAAARVAEAGDLFAPALRGGQSLPRLG